MANGRMINNAITKDLRINRLSDDTSRLAFTWLVTFADCEGRTYGDPAIVRSMIFPRREDVTIQRMTNYIQEWHDLGLIIWYEAGDDKFIWFPAFEKNQRGMRPDRETASIIPQQPGYTPKEHRKEQKLTPEQLRTNSGLTPDDSRIKLKQVKLKESKLTEAGAAGEPSDEFTALQHHIEQKIGLPIMPTQKNIDALNEMVELEIIQDDIDDALAYLHDRGVTVRDAFGVLGSARTSKAKRVQAGNNGKPKEKWIPEEHATEVYE